MDVSKSRGTPKWMIWVPLFLETPTSLNCPLKSPRPRPPKRSFLRLLREALQNTLQHLRKNTRDEVSKTNGCQKMAVKNKTTRDPYNGLQ